MKTIEAKDLRPGMITALYGGAEDVVEGVAPSKGGKTLTVTFISGGNRKFRAAQLIGVKVAPEADAATPDAPEAEAPATTQEAAPEVESAQETEAAHETRLDIAAFYAKYVEEYGFCKDNGDNVAGFAEAVKAFGAFCENEANAALVREFCEHMGDYITSDREAAAFMVALESMVAPPMCKPEADSAEAGQPAPQEAETVNEVERLTYTVYYQDSNHSFHVHKHFERLKDAAAFAVHCLLNDWDVVTLYDSAGTVYDPWDAKKQASA